jgi:hypothetical protein
MSIKSKVASDGGRWGRNNIPISGEWRVASGEWRVAKNEEPTNLNLVDQSILMCRQSINVMNGIFVNTPMEGWANIRHSPLVIRHSNAQPRY